MQKKSWILVVVLIASSLTASSQPADPSTNPDNPVPITGIEILLGLGALFGVRRIYKERRR